MKSLLMFFSPYRYVFIAEGIITVDMRRRVPVSKEWDRTIQCCMTKDIKSFNQLPEQLQDKYRSHFGKVGLEIKCGNIYVIAPYYPVSLGASALFEKYLADQQLLDKASLTHTELEACGKGRLVYAIEVADKTIYQPKDIAEFYTDSVNHKSYKGICRQRFVDSPNNNAHSSSPAAQSC